VCQALRPDQSLHYLSGTTYSYIAVLCPVAPGGGSTTGRDFEASDLGRLPLLSAVIKEALRLCTPVPYGGSREVVTEEGADLGGYHVPKVSRSL